jgi:hypothetical protein
MSRRAARRLAEAQRRGQSGNGARVLRRSKSDSADFQSSNGWAATDICHFAAWDAPELLCLLIVA